MPSTKSLMAKVRKLELEARRKRKAGRTRYVWVDDWKNPPEEAKPGDGEKVVCYGWAQDGREPEA